MNKLKIILSFSALIFFATLNRGAYCITVISEDFNDRSYSSPLMIWSDDCRGYDCGALSYVYTNSENNSGAGGYSLIRNDSVYNGSGYGSILLMNASTASHIQQGVYFRYYQKYASNYYQSDGDGGQPYDNDKLVKISGPNANIEISWRQSDADGFKQNFYTTYGCGAAYYNMPKILDGQWHKIEMYIYIPSSGGTPYLHIQVNDSDTFNRQWSCINRGPYSSILQMFGGVRASNMGGAPSGRGYRYLDDLTVVVGEGDLCNNEPAEPGGGGEVLPSAPINLEIIEDE